MARNTYTSAEELANAEQESAAQAVPLAVNPALGRQTHLLTVAQNPDGTPRRQIERPVALTWGQARKLGMDYYHPGGVIYNEQFEPVGVRQQKGWFIFGYKWQDDPEHVRPAREPLNEWPELKEYQERRAEAAAEALGEAARNLRALAEGGQKE